jgi:hypothetical protein
VQEPIQSQIRSVQKAEAILISIAVVTTISIFIILGRTPDSAEIPNKITLAAELGTGAFIAYLLYFLQERSNKSIKDLVKELHEYNETRKKHDDSVRAPMLKRINGFLSDFKSQIEIDRDTITNLDPSNRKELVTNWLRGYYGRDPGSAFHGLEKVKELEKESIYVMPYIKGDLRVILRSIIEDIEILYGIRANLSTLFLLHKDPAAKWDDNPKNTLSKIKRAQGHNDIQSETDSKN